MEYGEVKKQRMGGIMAGAAVVAAFLALGLSACVFLAVHESGLAIGQQHNESGPMMASSSSGARENPLSVSTRQTEVPDLGELIGTTPEQALSLIGHGAAIADAGAASAPWDSSAADLLTVALTAEKSDPRTGAPTVYLGVDSTGRVSEAGYSVSMESLGFSSQLTFRQAVQRVHVVERTLADAGVDVEAGAAALPADRGAYATYLDDGTTMVRQYATFGGECEVNGTVQPWVASLDYDYSEAIESGNLADTTHIIAVGVGFDTAAARQ